MRIASAVSPWKLNRENMLRIMNGERTASRLWRYGSHPSPRLYLAMTLLLGVIGQIAYGAADANQSARLIQTAAEVRQLSTQDAESQLPVRLRGVVTFFDRELSYRFIQDETAGVGLHVDGEAENVVLAAGQWMDIEGVTGIGEFAPVVQVRQAKVVGEGPFPAAQPVTFEQISTGQFDGQFIEVRGIVRTAGLSELGPQFKLVVSTGGGRLDVLVSGLPRKEADMVDSEVAVQGVCVTRFNRPRSLLDTRVLAQDVHIVKPAPADPFAIPAHRISSLPRLTPPGGCGHRVRVVGTVTLCDRRTIYVQEEVGGLCVETVTPAKLLAGDGVEVVGFLVPGEYSPMLADAQLRQFGTMDIPRPQKMTVDTVLTEAQDCRLIEIAARVVERSRHRSQRFLVLQSGGAIFHACLPQAGEERQWSAIPNGSFVSVSGVCRIDPRRDASPVEDSRASSFRLLLRSVEDIKVIRPPPFWSLPQLLWATGALALAALTAFAWVAVLRRQVSLQKEKLRHHLETEKSCEN
jgi:hypothetical protein